MNEEDYTENEDLKKAIASYGLKQDVARIHAEMMRELPAASPAPVRSIVFYLSRAVAAVFIFAAGAALYLYFSSTSANLYNEKFVAFEDGTQRSGDRDFSRAEQAFEEGVHYLEQNKTDSAISRFRETLNINARQESSVMRDDAEYYLALANLKNNNLDEALNLFTKIHESPNHFYHDRVSTWFMWKLKLLAWKNRR